MVISASRHSVLSTVLARVHVSLYACQSDFKSKPLSCGVDQSTGRMLSAPALNPLKIANWRQIGIKWRHFPGVDWLIGVICRQMATLRISQQQQTNHMDNTVVEVGCLFTCLSVHLYGSFNFYLTAYLFINCEEIPQNVNHEANELKTAHIFA